MPDNSWPERIFSRLAAIADESFDAAIGIGMHAMAGTPGAVCPHSYWHVTLCATAMKSP